MSSSLTDRIVGGQRAPGPIPWQVSIQKRFGGGQFAPFCGGTILDEVTVLSAAHCFADEWGYPNSITYMHVVAGALDLVNSPDEQVSIFKTSDYASPGFTTWRIGGFGGFCHFGDFLPIW